jgi:L-rhamnose-H+ transport protein
VFLLVAIFGAAWGVAQVLFGLALEQVGIALTFSIVLGISAAMGSLIPLLRLHHDRVFTRSGLASLIGVGLVLVGVALSATAGRIRDRSRGTKDTSIHKPAVGLLMAIASGICASMMNVGFAYGAPLAKAASEGGSKELWISNVIWVPLLVGGFIPNFLYSLYLLKTRGTMRFYRESCSLLNGFLALTMAILWFGSSVLYGAATVLLGALGPVVGWPLFMSLIVIVASLLGIWTGEWTHTDRRPLHIQVSAVAILVIAVIVLSRATL